MTLQQSLLDYVGGIEFGSQPLWELAAGQQQQIIAISIQVGNGLGFGHGLSPPVDRLVSGRSVTAE